MSVTNVRVFKNPTGSYHLKPSDAGSRIEVHNTITGLRTIADADAIIEAHKHTKTWRLKQHWNGKGTDRQFRTI